MPSEEKRRQESRRVRNNRIQTKQVRSVVSFPLREIISGWDRMVFEPQTYGTAPGASRYDYGKSTPRPGLCNKYSGGEYLRGNIKASDRRIHNGALLRSRNGQRVRDTLRKNKKGLLERLLYAKMAAGRAISHASAVRSVVEIVLLIAILAKQYEIAISPMWLYVAGICAVLSMLYVGHLDIKHKVYEKETEMNNKHNPQLMEASKRR